MEDVMKSAVTKIHPAEAEDAQTYFEQLMTYETDCWDMHEGLKMTNPDFVLLDVRSHALYEAGHISGALSLPHGKIIRRKMDQWPETTIFVVYCAGPHCNGATRAAIRLAKLNRLVKTMPGGITGWIDEGFPLITGPK
jgi:rhodanese-related sulfurtransferase